MFQCEHCTVYTVYTLHKQEGETGFHPTDGHNVGIIRKFGLAVVWWHLAYCISQRPHSIHTHTHNELPILCARPNYSRCSHKNEMFISMERRYSAMPSSAMITITFALYCVRIIVHSKHQTHSLSLCLTHIYSKSNCIVSRFRSHFSLNFAFISTAQVVCMQMELCTVRELHRHIKRVCACVWVCVSMAWNLYAVMKIICFALNSNS